MPNERKDKSELRSSQENKKSNYVTASPITLKQYISLFTLTLHFFSECFLIKFFGIPMLHFWTATVLELALITICFVSNKAHIKDERPSRPLNFFNVGVIFASAIFFFYRVQLEDGFATKIQFSTDHLTGNSLILSQIWKYCKTSLTKLTAFHTKTKPEMLTKIDLKSIVIPLHFSNIACIGYQVLELSNHFGNKSTLIVDLLQNFVCLTFFTKVFFFISTDLFSYFSLVINEKLYLLQPEIFFIGLKISCSSGAFSEAFVQRYILLSLSSIMLAYWIYTFTKWSCKHFY